MPTTNLPAGRLSELVLAAQSAFDTPVVTGFAKTPFYTESIAESSGLLDDDIIGGARDNYRDQRAPAPDLVGHGGALEVPLCLNNIGWWLIGAFGAPATSAVSATGSLVFSGQPAVGATITINGVEFTFVDESPSTNEIEIGGDLATTIGNIVTALNGSANGSVDDATYAPVGGTTVTVTHDTAGPEGNAFTLAASGDSNATPSGATLAGGAYSHVFESGAVTLPSRTIGIRKRVLSGSDDVWLRHVGCIVSMMRFRIAREANYRRIGIDLVGRNEGKVLPAVFDTPDEAYDLDQVAAALGQVLINDVAFGTLLSVDATFDNGLAGTNFANDSAFESGFSPDSPSKWSGTLRARYANEALYDQAQDGSAKSLEMLWTLGSGRSLSIACPSVRLARHSMPIGGPAGIEANIPFRGEQLADEPQLTVTLVNSIASWPAA